MKRGISTFVMILVLLAIALTFALSFSFLLSARDNQRFLGNSYSELALSNALAADALDARGDPEAAQTIAGMRELGLRLERGEPPPPARRVGTALAEVGYAIATLIGDPSRVVVTRDPNAEIWIRSSRDPQLWIVQDSSHRRRLLGRSILVAIVAGLIALLIAAIAAHWLARPLEHLAHNAGTWLAGEPMGPSLLGSSREVRHLAEAIGRAAERQRDVAHERELMLAGISHDLRTPLARLRIALELGDANDPQRRMAMVEDLEQLDNALEQCLAFVRDGRNEALRESDVSAIAGQLIGLREQPETWTLDAPTSLLATVRPTLLRRAIVNLMDNAERHGAAPFAVALTRNDKRLVIGVTDCGNGVATDLIDRIGQPFLRGDAARGSRGTGLGLSIVARIAHQHGGTLRVQNRTGGGFAAHIELPAGKP